MKVFEYELRFTTPAFLGNAQQDAQWRTPPIKALLRQWWRIVHAPKAGFDVAKLRGDEARLFGAAADNGNSTKSLVRIRLDQWTPGTLTAWPKQDPKIHHPEVDVAGGMVGSQLYLGFGPLVIKQGTALKANAAIQPGESARLSIAAPDDATSTFTAVLALVNLYGTVGGRSRNGWGSFVLKALDGTPPLLQESKPFQRPWRDALKLDWPHAIGADDRPLIWRTEPLPDWQQVMRRLAEIKIGLRTQFRFSSGDNTERPEDRHWLSYPVTRHRVKGWKERSGGEYRLPNSLRFKVRPAQGGGLHGVIFHVPCLPPAAFNPDRRAIESVWQRVHRFLDAPEQELSRISA